jgi:hypothetical protein
MEHRHSLKMIWCFLLPVLCPTNELLAAQSSSDELWRGFLTPPDVVRPPMFAEGKSQEDLRADMNWMMRIGLAAANCRARPAGMQPRHLEPEFKYMSPAWKEAFQYGASLTAVCDVELLLKAEPGYAGIGGPWVRPEQAMKKLVWSRTVVQGGRPFKVALARPPMTSGPFQDTPHTLLPIAAIEKATGNDERFYADEAVIAYRLPANETPTPPAQVAATSSAGPISNSLLSDRGLEKDLSLPAGQGMAWITLTYDRLRTIRTAVVGTSDLRTQMTARLEAKNESGAFHDVTVLMRDNVPQVTASFKPVTAKVFRFTFSYPNLDLAAVPAGLNASWPLPKSFALSKVLIDPEGRVNDFERKAGFAIADDYYAIATPGEAANAPVPISDVVDLSDKMAPDGTLGWNPPPGQWAVLRLGYSLLGTLNHPAPPGGTGLEVDKLNRGYVHDYMKTYLDSYSSILSPSLMGSHGLHALFLDSIESYTQNWTDDMLVQFRQLRGYDPHPWLPALTGVIIQSASASDKFLWDFRRTIAQLLARNFYAEVAAVTHSVGLKQYGEALEVGRPQLGDDIEMRRFSDVPMGAMWSFSSAEAPNSYATLVADQRGAASVAHLYGKNVAMAESFTNIFDPSAFAPRDLKPIADLEFVLGMNRLMAFGVDRNETWAEDASPWVSYLTRACYLLQQGRFVADVAYFYGEEAPLTALAGLGHLDDVPTNYAFDFVNADALLNLFDVEDGYLTTPSGMRYRILQLGGNSLRMTVAVLRKLKELVQKGATVIGAPPIESPSLADDENEFHALVDSLWSDGVAKHTVGKGRVLMAGNVDATLASLGAAPDLDYVTPEPNKHFLAFVHRKLPDGEIYFVNNRSTRDQTFDVTLRIAGKVPELWRAETGTREPVSYAIQGGRTTVPLQLEAGGAVFLVFRQSSRSNSMKLPKDAVTPLATLVGPWRVNFQKKRGAPSTLKFDKLASWSMHPNDGVKYFSGSASYTKSFNAPIQWFEQRGSYRIDLGDVRDLAQITLNGKNLGILWHAPFDINVTGVLHPGRNTIQVNVTNVWVNRMIGDAQAGATTPYASVVDHPSTFADGEPTEEDQPTSKGLAPHHTYKADAPLRLSGLLGPVTVYLMKHRASGKLPDVLPELLNHEVEIP